MLKVMVEDFESQDAASLSLAGVVSSISTAESTSELLDFSTVLKASKAIAGELILEKLLNKLMQIVLENAGAQRGVLLSEKLENFLIQAVSSEDNQIIDFSDKHLPLSIIYYVKRTQSCVVLSDAANDGIFTNDPYIETYQPQSVLCMPIIHQGKLTSILYLENNLTTDAFIPERIEVLRLLSDQIAISLENAQLYSQLLAANTQLEDYAKTLEDKVLQRTKQLESANQDLRDFAHVVAHDLKAPLRSIGIVAQWITADYADKLDEDGREQLDLLNHQVKRSQALINGVLHYSKMGGNEGEKVEVDLNILVSEAIQNLASPAQIELQIIGKLPTLLSDPIRLQQVFQNLIGNAIKYMDKPQGRITINCTDDHDYWKFSVADNGPGIPEKYFDHIFQLFKTIATRTNVDSTGIGLATVKKIVEMYGGKIWVESQVGQGSTFFFTLPK